MAMVCFQKLNFRGSSIAQIRRINEIIAEYQAQGHTLTVRQLYYQLVSRDIIPNNMKAYKATVELVSNGRLAGLIDWDAIEDRTRNLSRSPAWDNPAEIVDACARSFQLDLWRDQCVRPEVWVEKEALAGVFGGICRDLRIGYFSCRGYVSLSEMHDAAQRFRARQRSGQQTVILHFGDHDPSGLDMTRDLRERLALLGARVEVDRLALNMDQVEEHRPPPNPAKTTDARFAGYEEQHGESSWELDALPPPLLVQLARNAVEALIDRPAWEALRTQEVQDRALLRRVSERWEDIARGGDDRTDRAGGVGDDLVDD